MRNNNRKKKLLFFKFCFPKNSHIYTGTCGIVTKQKLRKGPFVHKLVTSASYNVSVRTTDPEPPRSSFFKLTFSMDFSHSEHPYQMKGLLNFKARKCRVNVIRVDIADTIFHLCKPQNALILQKYALASILK